MQRNYDQETNLVLSLCFSCTIENITFMGYGLIAYNLIGKSSFNDTTIDLSIRNLTSYLRYQGILLWYENLPHSNQDHYMMTVDGLSLTCYYSS